VKVSSLVRWLGPPTDRMEWSGRVKGRVGRGLKEKKGDKAENFES
jgi:hypothetical protein